MGRQRCRLAERSDQTSLIRTPGASDVESTRGTLRPQE